MIGARARSCLLAGVFAVAMASPAFAQTAVLRGLDKVTGQARDFSVRVGQTVRFGTLEVRARACQRRPAEETPEVSIYVEVADAPHVREGEQRQRREVFRGWLFASSPGLSALEHPVYDIWAIDCRS